MEGVEYTMEFLINGLPLKLTIDEETYTNLIANHNNTISYIKNLINCKVIEVETLKKLERVEEDGSRIVLLESEKENITPAADGEWSIPETKLLLDKYEQYLSLVGPMKRFKTKKIMWKQISTDIENILNINKTDLQCENRYKTVLKRKKKAIENNKTSGSSREQVPYEEELRKITGQDDSIEPEVLRGPSRCTIKTKEPSTNNEENHRKRPRLQETKKSFLEVYRQVQKEKEENRERRHQEKMELMKTLTNSLKN